MDVGYENQEGLSRSDLADAKAQTSGNPPPGHPNSTVVPANNVYESLTRVRGSRVLSTQVSTRQIPRHVWISLLVGAAALVVGFSLGFITGYFSRSFKGSCFGLGYVIEMALPSFRPNE